MTYTIVPRPAGDVPPQRLGFASEAGYDAAWRLWVATRRDGRLTAAEMEAKQGAFGDYLGWAGC